MKLQTGPVRYSWFNFPSDQLARRFTEKSDSPPVAPVDAWVPRTFFLISNCQRPPIPTCFPIFLTFLKPFETLKDIKFLSFK